MGAEIVEGGFTTSPIPFQAITPCRIVDTRAATGLSGAYGPPALAADATRDFDLNSAPHCPGIPANAEAYSLNVTVTETLGFGDIRIWPTGAFALVSTQNWQSAGVTLANAAIAPAGNDGSITVQAAGSGTHLIIDINGYYAGSIVTTLNNLSGNVTLVAGSNVTITPSGQMLTVAAAAGPGGDLPVGSSGQTLRHDGTIWVVNNALTSDGTDVALTGTLAFPPVARATVASGGVIPGGPFLRADAVDNNTFLGVHAGEAASPGLANTGIGFNALRFTGSSSGGNVAVGGGALVNNTSGDDNIAIGRAALENVMIGSGNIGIGADVGVNLVSGNNNIYIGNPGSTGSEQGQIRIGTAKVQTGAVIVGIHGVASAGGIPVIVNAGGRLGTDSSSRRFKEEIRDVGAESDGLLSLRPITFRYTPDRDPTGLRKYGLIAEEVAEVYPELVVYDEEGRPEAIRYQLLDALLLNEIQKQHRTLEAQRSEIAELRSRLAELEARSSPEAKN